MENKIGYVVLTTEEYKELILNNDKLNNTINEEIDLSFKCKELKEELHNILENAIQDVERFGIYNALDSYNINSKKLAKYLNENYMEEVMKIVAERAKNKEEKKDE